MSVKEKIVMMVVVVALVMAMVTLNRLSNDALGMLIGVTIGLGITVPMLAAVAWAAGKSHADQSARHDKAQEALLETLRHHEQQNLLEARYRGREAARPTPPAPSPILVIPYPPTQQRPQVRHEAVRPTQQIIPASPRYIEEAAWDGGDVWEDAEMW